jgi:hypothetical protein
MSDGSESPYKTSSRLAAGFVILLEVAALAGLQLGLSKGVLFNVSHGHPTTPFLSMLHLHAFHFRNISLWLLLHVVTLGAGLSIVAFGSPKWVHRATHATTLWALLLGALLMATFVTG